MQEEIEHLDGLAKSHVVGEAGAKSQFRHEPQPAHALDLIRPQRRLQIAARFAFRQLAGRTHLFERLSHPVAGDDRRPLRELFGLVLDGGDRSARQHSHAIDDRQAVGMLLANPLPMPQRFLQFRAIDLNPAATQHRQARGPRYQLLQLFTRQRLAAQRDADVEIEQSIQPDGGWFVFPQPHLHLWTRLAPRLPPIRQPDDYARRLHGRRLDEESVSLVRRPGLSGEELPCFEQTRDERRVGGGAADRLQQQFQLV